MNLGLLTRGVGTSISSRHQTTFEDEPKDRGEIRGLLSFSHPESPLTVTSQSQAQGTGTDVVDTSSGSGRFVSVCETVSGPNPWTGSCNDHGCRY